MAIISKPVTKVALCGRGSVMMDERIVELSFRTTITQYMTTTTRMRRRSMLICSVQIVAVERRSYDGGGLVPLKSERKDCRPEK